MRTRSLAALALAGVASCSSDATDDAGSEAADNGDAWFDEVAAKSGLVFRHESGHRERFLMPEIMGGGVALFDMDDDGDLDAYLVQGGSLEAPESERPSNQLFRNRGDGAFDDVTAESGADDRGYGMGVATGDADGDGDTDLLVTNVGPNVLLVNEGGGRFSDGTEAARVGDASWGASATFYDQDRDGDLDLFVTNYLHWSVESEIDCHNLSVGGLDYCSPLGYDAPTADTVYRNEGGGVFTDISVASGVAARPGTGLGVVAGDFDADGFVDVFVANDGMMDRLWINDGEGAFEDKAVLLGCAVDENGRPKAGMGVTAGDYDGDGDLDLLVCNLRAETDSLYQNTEHGFIDASARSGLAPISRSFTRFGMAWADFDNDGIFDLYQANGRVTVVDIDEPNVLVRGLSDGRFEEVPLGGTRELLVATSRGAAFGDLDNDGGIDVVVVNRDTPTYVLRNRVAPRGNWLLLEVLSQEGAHAIGARVELRVNGKLFVREVRTGYSYLAASDPRVHLGLGDADSVTVDVVWPDGVRESYGELGANRVHTLRRQSPREEMR